MKVNILKKKGITVTKTAISIIICIMILLGVYFWTEKNDYISKRKYFKLFQ